MKDISNKFQIENHTADLGIKIFSESYQAIFIDATQVLYFLMTEYIPKIDNSEFENFQIKGANRELTLHNWLSEVLSLFWSDRVMLYDITPIKVTNTEVQIKARTEQCDFEEMEFKNEIKAVTYHNFEIKEVDNEFRTNIIFDV